MLRYGSSFFLCRLLLFTTIRQYILGLRVAQLEKEKNELNERLLVIAKRLFYVERAFREEVSPLLA